MSEGPAPPKVSRRLAAAINFLFSHVNTALVVTQGILLVPLYFAHVSRDLYGAWLATGNILSWIELVDPGISAVLTRQVAHTSGSGDRARLARVIGTGLVVGLGLACLPLVAWPLAGHLGGFVRVSGREGAELAHAFHLGLAASALTLASYATTSVLTGLQLAFRTGVVYTVSAVCGIASTVWFFHRGYGLASIPMGSLVRGAMLVTLTGSLVTHWCARYLPERPRFDRAELHGLAGTSVYTFLSRLGATLAGRMDAVITARALSTSQTTVYTITGKALDPVRLVAASVGGAIQSGFAHLLGEGNKPRAAEVMGQANRAVGFGSVLLMSCVVALDQAFVTLWVGPANYGGHRLAAALAVSTALSTFTLSLNQLVFAAGGIRPSALLGLAEAAVKLGLQVLLVRRLGLLGMPLASAIASLCVSGWTLPRIAAGLVGASPGDAARFWLTQVARLVVGVSAGAAVAWLLARAAIRWTWPGFFAAAALVGTCFGAVALATDPGARALLLSRLRRGK
ncbi:MAG: oligosaccharide flippase family protein [Polyangiales bacterium]